ncbi:unnamed protein product, partial [Urochloa humidicola]
HTLTLRVAAAWRTGLRRRRSQMEACENRRRAYRIRRRHALYDRALVEVMYDGDDRRDGASRRP